MPRINPGRTIGRESLVAQRVAALREARGWTYEGLASRMSAAGCNIQASGLYKIEKADPPRRITVDELVAFAAVFDVTLESLTAHESDAYAELERVSSALLVAQVVVQDLQAQVLERQNALDTARAEEARLAAESARLWSTLPPNEQGEWSVVASSPTQVKIRPKRKGATRG